MFFTTSNISCTPTNEEFRRPRRDAPAVDQVNKFPGISLHRKSHSTVCHTIATRGCPCGGGGAPESTLCSKNPGSNTHRESRNPEGKNPSKPPYPTIRIPLFPSYNADRGGSRVFSIKKPGIFFPFRNPLYFSAIMQFRADPECRTIC